MLWCNLTHGRRIEARLPNMVEEMHDRVPSTALKREGNNYGLASRTDSRVSVQAAIFMPAVIRNPDCDSIGFLSNFWTV